MVRAVVGIALIFLGCGAQGPRAPGAPPSLVAAPPVEAAADLSPVATPTDLQAHLHVAHPARDVATIAQLIPDGGDVVEALRDGPEPFVTVMIGEEHARTVDFSAPIDLAVVGQEGDLVMSLGLRDGERERPAPVAKSLRCARVPARAPRWRLVCAETRALIDAYAPYLTRTVAGAPVPSAVRLTLFGAAMARGVSQAPASNDPGELMGRRLVADLFQDLDAVAFDLTLSERSVQVAAEVRFSRARSLFATALAARPGAEQAVPEAFWSVPRDADLVVATRGAAPGAFGDTMKPLFEEFWREAYASSGKLSQAAIDERVTALRRIVLTGGPLLYAQGHAPDAALAALAGASEREVSPREARQALRRWTLFRVEEPVDHWREGVRDVVRLLNAPVAGLGEPGGPGGPTPDVAKVEPRERERWSLPPVKATERLPKGSFRMQLVTGPNPRYRPTEAAPALQADVLTHFLFVPEGTATWLIVAEDLALASAIARRVLTPDVGATLASRADLEGLRALTGHSAGFVTLAGIVCRGLELDAGVQLAGSRATLTRLNALPDRGASPIVLHGVSRTEGEGVVARMSGTLPPSALASLFSWGLAHTPPGGGP